MRNNKPFIYVLILLCACVGACANSSYQTSMAIATSTIPATKQIIPSVATMVPRFFPTQTPAPSPTWGAVQCSNSGIPLHPPSEFGFEGSVIYWDPTEWRYFLFGGKPLERYVFEISDEYSVIGFSSSGSLLAFRESSSNSLEIVDITGNRWQVNPVVDGLDLEVDETIERYLFEYVTWLGDSALFVQIYPIGGGEQHLPYPAILDIRSGEWVEEVISSLPDRNPTSVAIPSPNLHYLAYSGLSVWSVKDASRLWTSQNYDHSLSLTKGHGIQRFLLWSPTSKFLTYTSHDSAQQQYDRAWTRDVYLVDVIGKTEKKITNLSDYPAIVSDLLAWSPDGRYLAIDATIGSSGHASFKLYLLIYDTYENEFAYSCQMSDAESISSLVWSPSSDSFIFYTSCSSFDCPRPLRYGEVVSGKMYTLVEDIGHLGQGWALIAPSEFDEP